MTSRRRFCYACLVLAVVVVAALLAVGATNSRSPVLPPRFVAATDRAVTARESIRRRGHTARVATPSSLFPSSSNTSPGSLPQTHAYPSGTSLQFRSLMASLWSGIVHDSLNTALPAFFPRGAYVQLKAIHAAGSDWRERLVHGYRLDIAAAHALLGRDARSATLIAVDVPSSYGHWVQPGVCYNRIGYYEMPNARVVYRAHGATRSFGIASMISWRGVWYVVHLGAVFRSTDAGTVDEPSFGRGTSVYSGTC